MKGSAGADGALHMNFSGMFLNDSIRDGKTEARSAAVARFGRGFGGEEGIVNALEMLGRDAGAGIGDKGLDVSVDKCGNAQAAASGHGFLGVEQEIEKDLLELSGIAMDGGQFAG